jgi:hypothetical protein
MEYVVLFAPQGHIITDDNLTFIWDNIPGPEKMVKRYTCFCIIKGTIESCKQLREVLPGWKMGVLSTSRKSI